MFNSLLKWSKDNFSELPWRTNRSLYGTLVSEIMLQQTTVGTVLNHFNRFMKEYPDLKSLAKASDEQLTISWKGLGYYRRARNLKKAAETISKEFKGEFPTDTEVLKTIPGIGEYTAHALLSIGMNKPALAVDANLERVIERFYGVQDNSKKNIKKLFDDGKLFKEVKKNQFRNLNEALMDLGRTICQANKVQCMICPLNENCQGYKAGTIVLKRDKKEKVKPLNLKLLRIVVRKKDSLLVYKKIKGEWLEGQYETPTFILECDDDKLKQYDKAPKLKIDKPKKFKTGITKYDIENVIVEMSEREFFKLIKNSRDYHFRKLDLQGDNFATSVQKLVRVLG